MTLSILFCIFTSAFAINPDELFNGTSFLLIESYYLSHRPFQRRVVPSLDGEGRLCEFAASRNVAVDVMVLHCAEMLKNDTVSQTFVRDARRSMIACVRDVFLCARDALDCIDSGSHDVLRHRDYDAGYAFGEEHTTFAALERVLARSARPRRTQTMRADVTVSETWFTKSELLSRMNAADEAVTVDAARCAVSDDLLRRVRFPVFVKFDLGTGSSAGNGGTCLRHMAVARSEAELRRKLLFFCLPTIRRFSTWLHVGGSQRPIVCPFYGGGEASVDVVVFRGKVVGKVWRRARFEHGGVRYESAPAVFPQGIILTGEEDVGGVSSVSRAAQRNCDALVERAVVASGVWNRLIGMQLRIETESGACTLIEVNQRQHIGDKVHDTQFGLKRYDTLWDSGAIALYLAFDIDPTPLLMHPPRETRSAILVGCREHSQNVQFNVDDSIYPAWMRQDGLCNVTFAATPQLLWRHPAFPQLPDDFATKALPFGEELHNICRSQSWMFRQKKEPFLADYNSLVAGDHDGKEALRSEL